MVKLIVVQFMKNTGNEKCLFQELCCAENYLPIIERKYSKLIHDLDFAAFANNCSSPREIAEKIASEVAEKVYMPKSVVPKQIFFLAGGKKRRRYVYPLKGKDLVIFILLEKLLLRCLNPTDYCHVYSNFLGKNFLHAVHDLAKAFKANAKDNKLDLYLVNGDITKFYDTIPLDQHSHLWDQLNELCVNNTSSEHLPYLTKIIQSSVHPYISRESGNHYFQNIIGIPTGSPLCRLLSNIYLKPFDDHFSKIDGGNYLRYVDDFVFLHSNPKTVLEAFADAEKVLSGLHLKINADKTYFFYLTRCGRASPIKGFTGRDNIDFLACRIHANGVISASNRNLRNLFKAVRRRMASTMRLIQTQGNLAGWQEKLPYLVQTVNAVLNPKHPLSAEVVQTILKKNQDIRQMKFIDRQILLLLAQQATGIKGVKAFRTLPMKEILKRGPVFSLARYKWKSHEYSFSK